MLRQICILLRYNIVFPHLFLALHVLSENNMHYFLGKCSQCLVLQKNLNRQKWNALCANLYLSQSDYLCMQPKGGLPVWSNVFSLHYSICVEVTQSKHGIRPTEAPGVISYRAELYIPAYLRPWLNQNWIS